MLRHAEILIRHADNSDGSAAMLYGMLRHTFVRAKDPVARGIVAMHDCVIARILLLSARYDSAGSRLHLTGIPVPYFARPAWHRLM